MSYSLDKIYIPAGINSAPEIFKTIQIYGEKTLDINGVPKKNCGWVPKSEKKNSQDPANKWGITPICLKHYYNLQLAPVNKEIRLTNQKIKKISRLIKNTLNEIKKLNKLKNITYDERSKKLCELNIKLSKCNSLLLITQGILKNLNDKKTTLLNSQIPLRSLSYNQALVIYSDLFYDRPDFEKLPIGIAQIMSDIAFSGGISAAMKIFKSIFGNFKQKDPNVLTPNMIAAVEKYIEKNGQISLIKKISKAYATRLERIRTAAKKHVSEDGVVTYSYPKLAYVGWKARVTDIQNFAIKMTINSYTNFEHQIAQIDIFKKRKVDKNILEL